MSTYDLHSWLFEQVAGTTTGTFSVGSGPDAYDVSVDIPGIKEPQGGHTDPHVEMSIPDTARITPNLKGDTIREEGSVFAVVVCRVGDNAPQPYKKLRDIADHIVTLCPPGPVHVVSGWSVQFMVQPEVRALYRDEADCRLPVVIRYRATRDA